MDKKSVGSFVVLLQTALADRSTRKQSPSTDQPVDSSVVVEGDRLRVERAARAGRKSTPNGPTEVLI